MSLSRGSSEINHLYALSFFESYNKGLVMGPSIRVRCGDGFLFDEEEKGEIWITGGRNAWCVFVGGGACGGCIIVSMHQYIVLVHCTLYITFCPP